MRSVLYVLIGAVAMLVVGGYSFVRRPVPLPHVALGIDPQCIEAMRRPPDMTWVAPGHPGSGARATPISYAQLPTHAGRGVRVAGVLHYEFEDVGFYRSFEAMRGRGYPYTAPYVQLSTLWPGEPPWLTRSPYISDRCAVVEGTVQTGGGGVGVGAILGVTRLDVWSMPHWPVTPPSAPPASVEAERTAATRQVMSLRHRIDLVGPVRTLAGIVARPDEQKALVHAMGEGGREGLAVARVLWRVADAPAVGVLRRGLQEATATNTRNVVHFVSDGAFDVRDACRTDTSPPSSDRTWATVHAIGRIDWRIANLLKIQDASLAAVVDDCIAELRREREAVLARAAAGSEPWRPRPGR
jgi:hypothetical protein